MSILAPDDEISHLAYEQGNHMNQPNLRTVLRNAILALLLFALCAPSTAQAGQSIEFTHEGTTLEGFILDGQAFPGQFDFIITAFGDVADRQEFASGYFIEHLFATIEIVGVGEFEILSPTLTFVNQSVQRVGFSAVGPPPRDLFNGPTNPGFLEWDMTTSIGPVSGNDGELKQWHIPPLIETTGGILEFDDEEDIPVIFTAEVIPAPGPIALLAPAAGAFCILRRRRRC